MTLRSILYLFFGFSILSACANKQESKLPKQSTKTSELEFHSNDTLDFKLLEIKDPAIKGGTAFYKNLVYSGWVKHDLMPKSESYNLYQFEAGQMIRNQNFYLSGQISRNVPMKDGTENGMVTMHHPNGQLYVEEFYIDGKPHGIFRRWNELGLLLAEKKFDYGVLEKEFESEGVVR